MLATSPNRLCQSPTERRTCARIAVRNMALPWMLSRITISVKAGLQKESVVSEPATVADLILDLQHAVEHSRALDSAISRVLGYKMNVTYKTDGGKKVRNVVWLSPSLGQLRKIPFYTLSIDDAKALSQKLLPGCASGFMWTKDRASARVDDGPIFNAATPALALCAAALAAAYHPLA